MSKNKNLSTGTPLTKLIGLLKPDSLLPALTAGGSNAVLVISVELSLAAMLFAGELTPFMPQAIGLLLCGTFIIGMVLTIKSSHPSAVALVQDAPIAILSVPLLAVYTSMTSDAVSRDAIFYTLVMTMMMSTLVTGLLLVSMARFKLGDLVRFIPYPVIGGFLAGIGWLLFKGGIGVMTGLPTDLAALSGLFVPLALLKWIPGLLFALLLYYLLCNHNHFMIMPVMVIGAIILFFIILRLLNVSFAETSAAGWFLGPFPKGALWEPFSFSGLVQVRWDLVIGQALTMVSIFIITVIALLLNASGLELITRKDIDLNNELKITGIANLLAVFSGCTPGYMGLSTSALSHRLTPGSRLSGFITALICGLVLIFGATIISAFPRPIAGAMLVLVGFDMLWEWLYDSWSKLPLMDYILIPVILIVIATVGFLQGVGVGLVIAVILFVINYSRINIVKSASTGKHLRSNVERPAPHRWTLDTNGNRIQILQLQGFIFFGTANQLRNRIVRTAAQVDKLQFIVLDFQNVNGFDSSALNSFERIHQFAQSRNIHLVFVSLDHSLKKQFEKTGITAESVTFLPDLDHGIEWCENKLLLEAKNHSASRRNQILESTYEEMLTALGQMEIFEGLIADMSDYLEPNQINQGEYLFRSGGATHGLYLIESGQISILLDQEDAKSQTSARLRTMGAGTIIGEWGDRDYNRSTTTVEVTGSGRLYHLSDENLARMERNEPELALGLYKYMTQVLSERLSRTNHIIRDLL